MKFNHFTTASAGIVDTKSPVTLRTSQQQLTKMPTEKLQRSLMKAISWRVIASVTTFIVTFIIIKLSPYHLDLATTTAISLRVTLLEAIIKIVIYFIHERAWLKIAYGKKSI